MTISWSLCYFNPRPPRGGRRSHETETILIDIFQSTPPARGATRNRELSGEPPVQYFNPRPPRGGRLIQSRQKNRILILFQSTPPARGATHETLTRMTRSQIFQSTPPARGATRVFLVSRDLGGISIHAPREGGDSSLRLGSVMTVISIHAPREGGDAGLSPYAIATATFQSTPPARGATAKMHSFTRGSLTNK